MTGSAARPLPPQPAPMHRILSDRAAGHGERAAVLFDDRTLSYAALDRDVRAVATGLQACGIGPGDVVLIMLSNRSEMLISLLASAHLGAVAAPVNHALNGDSLAHVCGIARARLAIIEAEFLPRLRAALQDWGTLERLLVVGEAAGEPGTRVDSFTTLLDTDSKTLRPAVVTGASPWLILFTSGTTGVSKGVVLPHQQVSSAAWDAMHDGGLDESSVFYTFNPLFHLNAIVFGPLAAIMSGARAVVRHDFARERLLEDLKRTGATHWTVVPFVLRGLLSQPEQPDDKDNRLKFTLGYGLIPEEIETFERRFGCPLYCAYGATESGMLCTAQPARMSTAGRISNRHEIRIVDGDGKDLPRNEVGEIWSRARQPYDRMLGYYGMPEQTADAFSGEWFKTGDRAWLDEDDGLHFSDRVKEMLKRRGENISTYEVENVLRKFPGVASVAVVGYQPTPDSEEEVRAFVELDPAVSRTLDHAALIDHCSRNLAYFMVPRFIDVVSELPRTALGKLEKHRLKNQPATAETFDLKRSGLSVRR